MNIFVILSVLLSFCSALEYSEVTSIVQSDGLLHLGNKSWRSWLKNEDYAMFLLITAIDPRVGCVLCREFDPTYKSVARSYWESLAESPLDDLRDDRSKIVFAIAELNDVKEFFQAYDIKQVPKMFYYAPGRGPQVMTPNEEYQFLVDETVENFQNWVVDLTPKLNRNRLQVVVRRTNGAIFMAIALFLSVIGLGYTKRALLLKTMQSKTLWMVLTLSLVTIFVSGHMFNQIRKTPNVRTGQKGEKIFIQPGQQVQLGMETKIVFTIYSILTAALVSLIKVVPGIKDTKMKMVVCLVTCLVLTLAYSGLVNAFNVKSVSYPFHLFKFL